MQEDIPTLVAALVGRSRGDVDLVSFILTTQALFDRLLTEPAVCSIRKGLIVSQVRRDTVYLTYPNLDAQEVIKAVEQLVSINLLSFLNFNTICFHRRILKFVHKQIRNDQEYLLVLSRAQHEYQLRGPAVVGPPQ